MVTIGAAGAIIPNDIAQSATVQFSERRARPGEFSADTVCVLYSLGAYPTEFGGQFIFDSISVTDPVGRPAKPNAIQSQRIWKEINASWSGHWSATDQWVKDDFLSVVSPSDAIPENVQSPANEVFADLPSGGVANPFENEVIESTDKYLAEMEYCSHTPGADILAREKRASAGLLLCINKLAQLKTPNARRTLEKIRNSDVLFAQEIQAAKTALAKFADPHCQSCKVIHKHLRLWLDGPEPNLYLCDECIRNQGLHESIGNSVTPSLMPHLIAENQLLEGPGLGGPAFSLALDAWNSGSHSLAAEKYSEALGKGLNPPYEAAARSNFGQILLNDGRIREALVQFSGALFVSPQMAESAYDAAIRLFIINEELGQTAQAGRAERIAQIAAARINSSLSPESAKRIRRLVRDKFPKE